MIYNELVVKLGKEFHLERAKHIINGAVYYSLHRPGESIPVVSCDWYSINVRSDASICAWLLAAGLRSYSVGPLIVFRK